MFGNALQEPVKTRSWSFTPLSHSEGPDLAEAPDHVLMYSSSESMYSSNFYTSRIVKSFHHITAWDKEENVSLVAYRHDLYHSSNACPNQPKS